MCMVREVVTKILITIIIVSWGGWRELKSVETIKLIIIIIITKELNKYFCAKQVTLFVEFWLQVSNKNHFKLKTKSVKLVLALLKNPKILCDVLWLISVLFRHVTSNCWPFMFFDTLVQVAAPSADMNSLATGVHRQAKLFEVNCF